MVASAIRISRDDLLHYHREHEGKIVYVEGFVVHVSGAEKILAVLMSVLEGATFEDGRNVYLGYNNAPTRYVCGLRKLTIIFDLI